MDKSAIIIMTTALIFYTTGVWAEKINGRLKYWHLFLFIFGLICDTLGTGLMFQISDGISFSFHGILGLAAIILMLFHATWATFALIKNEERIITNFHRFSLVVWIIWLIPYLSPMFVNII